MDIKLQKYVSDCGLMSRRSAEKEIAAGFFRINGETATIGDRVEPSRDKVTYKDKPITPQAQKVYIVFNKPTGCVTSMKDEKGRRCVGDMVASAGRHVYPVGRLDLDSEGMLICTNDGEFANRLMHPSGDVEKIYIAEIASHADDEAMRRLRAMDSLDGERIRRVRVLRMVSTDGKYRLKFILIEGKNRQIRRMCEIAGLKIVSLRRVSIGGITMGRLRSGEWRNLTPQELKLLGKK